MRPSLKIQLSRWIDSNETHTHTLLCTHIHEHVAQSVHPVFVWPHSRPRVVRIESIKLASGQPATNKCADKRTGDKRNNDTNNTPPPTAFGAERECALEQVQ